MQRGGWVAIAEVFYCVREKKLKRHVKRLDKKGIKAEIFGNVCTSIRGNMAVFIWLCIVGGAIYYVNDSNIHLFLKVVIEFTLAFTFLLCVIGVWISGKIVDVIEGACSVGKSAAKTGSKAAKKYIEKELEELDRAGTHCKENSHRRAEPIDPDFDEQLKNEASLHGPSVSGILKNF